MLSRAVAGNFALISEQEVKAMGMRSMNGIHGKSVSGETFFHWAVLGGCERSVQAWLEAGGGFVPDKHGANPMHWLAGTASGSWGIISACDPWRSQFEQACRERDALGRDVVGLLCLGRESGKLSRLVKWLPSLARSPVNLGAGRSMNIFDALLACNVRVFVDDLDHNLVAAGSVLPSRIMPPQLESSGLWDQELWSLAREALLGPMLKAQQEGQDIALDVCNYIVRSGKASRI